MGKKKGKQKEPSSESESDDDSEDPPAAKADAKDAKEAPKERESSVRESAVKVKARNCLKQVEALLAPLLLAYWFPDRMKRFATRRFLSITLFAETILAGLRVFYLVVFYEATCQLPMKICSGIVSAVSLVGVWFVSTRNVVKCRAYSRLSALMMAGVLAMMVSLLIDDACNCDAYHECYKLDKIAWWVYGGTVFNPYTKGSKDGATALPGYSHYPQDPRWQGMQSIPEAAPKLAPKGPKEYPTDLLEEEPPKAGATIDEYCSHFQGQDNALCTSQPADPAKEQALKEQVAEQARAEDDAQAAEEQRADAGLELGAAGEISGGALLDTGFVVDASAGLRRFGDRVSLDAKQRRLEQKRLRKRQLLERLRASRSPSPTRVEVGHVRPLSRSGEGASLLEDPEGGKPKDAATDAAKDAAPVQESEEWKLFKEHYSFQKSRRTEERIRELAVTKRQWCHCEIDWTSTAPPCKRTPAGSEHGPWRFWCYVDPESADKCNDVKYSVVGNQAFAWTFEACEKEVAGSSRKQGRCDCVEPDATHSIAANQLLPAKQELVGEFVNPKARNKVAGELKEGKLENGRFGIGCSAWTNPTGIWTKDPKDELFDDIEQEGAKGSFVNYKFSASWCFVDSDSMCPYIGRMVDDDSTRNSKVTMLFSWWPCRRQSDDSQEYVWKRDSEYICYVFFYITLVNMIVLFILQWVRMSVLAMFIKQQCFDSSILTVEGGNLQTPTAADADLWGESDDDFDDGVDDDDDDDDDDDGKKRKK